MTTYSALTIREPYATLVVINQKRIETRGWPAPKALIGQRIAIHAAKRKPTEGEQVGDWTVHEMADSSWRMYLNDDDARSLADDSEALPLGCVVATAQLDACLPITGSNDAGYDEFICPNIYDQLTLYRFGNGGDHPATTEDDITDQLRYGDWSEGRYGWVLSAVKRVDPLVPFVGGQGLSRRWEGP